MTPRIFFAFMLTLYLLLIIPFTDYLNKRPVAIKLGYSPPASILKPVLGDQRTLAAEWSVLKVLFYYGALIEKAGVNKQYFAPPEYYTMFKTIQTSTELDPYNADAYYFAQAAFTWEVGRFADVNGLLDYGMKHRTWDYQLPFFAGFNAAYFMHDYDKGASYLKKAADISGNPFFVTLAARYFYEAGKNDLGVMYLSSMENGATDEKVRNVYKIRLEALKAVKLLETAVAGYRQKYGRLPDNVLQLKTRGILKELPADPYGGTFYMDSDGKIRSTSKFAFGGGGK